jgi:diadenosine tetraphosphatase ApaH/serine/threonine PP2A family protein phosphatase
VLVGHSHIALGIGLVASDLVGGAAPAGTQLELEGRWLLNPGSVGQPRDGDPRAAWLLLDTGAKRAEFRRVDYAIEETQAAMRAAGLPDPLAARLAQGI